MSSLGKVLRKKSPLLKSDWLSQRVQSVRFSKALISYAPYCERFKWKCHFTQVPFKFASFCSRKFLFLFFEVKKALFQVTENPGKQIPKIIKADISTNLINSKYHQTLLTQYAYILTHPTGDHFVISLTQFKMKRLLSVGNLLKN